jgi:effector-binding domain-containing protein
LYKDDVPNVEIGVELLVACQLTGRVVASTLPAGQVAMTTHWGPYSELGGAYQAVTDWCAAQGKQRTETRWEVYGPHNDDPAKVWTELYWLLA